MTWAELADANRESARYLRQDANTSHHRGVCNRAYYSTYALITSRLPTGIMFGNGRQNPINIYANIETELEQNNNLTVLFVPAINDQD